MKPIEEIKKNLNTDKMLIGTNETLRALRRGKISKVFVASNCEPETKHALEHYTEMQKIPLVELEVPNKEIGVVCRKQFSISVIGLK